MRYFVCVFCLILLLSTPAMAVAEGEAARVKTFKGTAFIVRQQQAIQVKQHDRIYPGDLLRTGPDGTMGVIFRDNTTLSLGPRSEIAVDEFLFAPSQGKLSIVTRMFRGTAAYLSGVIAKLSPASVRFETPAATIGIRGTHFLVQVEGADKK
ncbi:FecR family protein [Syntrophus aciditrophicus]|nr:FecR domain-containing protein [Syntrophus aciditrophicus]OPY16830.1 MAG: FecR protein [Syntrophus sp. PtaB.Bin075]